VLFGERQKLLADRLNGMAGGSHRLQCNCWRIEDRKRANKKPANHPHKIDATGSRGLDSPRCVA